MVGVSLKIAVAVAGLAIAASAPAFAQGVAPAKPELKPEMMANCPGLVAARPLLPVPAAFRIAALQADQVRISFAGHSTFLIESPQLVRIATDYNDFVKPAILPDIVTMNHAHSSHYTDAPDPGIKHVLRGWAGDEKPARIDLQFKDVRVRNVPTNIRGWGGDTERHGNSVFIFEIANLCIAHLGHLHHTLTQQQLNEIGQVDVVMVPVDGTMTLDLAGMVDVLQALKAPLIIPMHYFNAYSLDRFLQRVRETWDVEIADVPSVVVSKTSLPVKPKVLVLPGL
ncbi:MAG: MBL fold metallo-hydrolase [Pseudolabrys sp.]|nr:MBL fold metallo-hydrolase [Pseudolabrys sp.]